MNIKRFAFRPDTILEMGEQRLQLQQLVDGTWNCQDLKTNLYTTIPVVDLLRAYQEGKIKIMTSMPGYHEAKQVSYQSSLSLDQLSTEIQEKVHARYKFLDAIRLKFENLPPATMLKDEIEHHWKSEEKPSVRSVQRWWKGWINANFSILSLVDRSVYKGNRVTKIHGELERICLDALNAVYLTQARGTFVDTLSYCRDLVRKANHGRHPDDLVPMPSMQSLRSVLKSIDPYAVYKERFGADAARVKFRRALGSKLVENPLDRVEIDHTRLNLIVVDPSTGMVIGRPWLSLAIDYDTRAILAFHLSMAAPSSSTLATLLIKIISPKTGLREAYPDLKHDWNMYGIPKLIAVDNGLEFHSSSFKDACMQLGISIQYMARKTPWWKARIERNVGTVNNHLSSLMPGGQTFRSIQEKGDANPHKTACMTLDMIEQLMTLWVVDFYHQDMHRSLRTSPQYVWDTKANPESIELLEDLSVLKAICGNIAFRRLFHYGIEINNVRYNSLELTKLHHAGIKEVTLRWNSEDVGSVIVYTKDGQHIEVPAGYEYSHLKGISLVHYLVARQDLINRKLRKFTQEELDATLARIINLAKKHAEETMAIRHHYKRVIKTVPATPQLAQTPAANITKPKPSGSPAIQRLMATASSFECSE